MHHGPERPVVFPAKPLVVTSRTSQTHGSRAPVGVWRAADGQVVGGDRDGAAVTWYRDSLPTNCVADWVCPTSTAAGYPKSTNTQGPEYAFYNHAVFHEACSLAP
jgi:pyruvate formate lyase activating enzyme